jgi:phosphatidylglycerol:prolipoprotein diacylglycerol transferase
LIDPVIVEFQIFGFNIAIHWYGVIIGVSVIIGSLIAEREIVKRGGREGYVWDLLIWVVAGGIVGARLWYVLNDIAGGSTNFLDDPVGIFRIWEGGLHIYGAIALGLIVAFSFTRRHPFDRWLLLDAMAPTLLIAQAFGRLANFINQELYGPPTELAWGVKIAAENRIAPWNDLAAFPVESTRFHPTFFYEMIWNLLAAAIIIWLWRKFGERLKPGAAFFIWMLLEGGGRFWLEYFRPDQPVVPGTAISYSRIVATLLAVIGALLLLVRYEKVRLPFLSPGPEKYVFRKDRKWKK